MEIVVLAFNAPAGKTNSILPSVDLIDPPVVPMVLLSGIPIGAPIGVTAAGRSGRLSVVPDFLQEENKTTVPRRQPRYKA
jgi:hypothetical protein